MATKTYDLDTECANCLTTNIIEIPTSFRFYPVDHLDPHNLFAVFGGSKRGSGYYRKEKDDSETGWHWHLVKKRCTHCRCAALRIKKEIAEGTTSGDLKNHSIR